MWSFEPREDLTICRCERKVAHSPQLFKDPESWSDQASKPRPPRSANRAGVCRENRVTLERRIEIMTYHAEPDTPAVYIVQSSRPVSLRAQNTPLRDAMARNPPPDPNTAIEGT